MPSRPHLVDSYAELSTDARECRIDLGDDRDQLERPSLRQLPLLADENLRSDELPYHRPIQLRLHLDQLDVGGRAAKKPNQAVFSHACLAFAWQILFQVPRRSPQVHL